MADRVVASSAEGNVDCLVQEAFFTGRHQGRVCVEVGAARPDYLSVGCFFRRLGWRVLSVEPNPAFCEMHRGKGHEVYQYACGDRDEDAVDFFVVDLRGMPYKGGEVSYESFSSLGVRGDYAQLAETYAQWAEGRPLDVTKVSVKLRKLDTLLARHAPEVHRIDLLVVDVEGWELEVLRGLDFGRYRPRVMIIENLFRTPEYHDFMAARGYELWRDVPPNEIYVQRGRFPGRALRWLGSLAGRVALLRPHLPLLRHRSSPQ
jgi:FkbM family methyltransferase